MRAIIPTATPCTAQRRRAVFDGRSIRARRRGCTSMYIEGCLTCGPSKACQQSSHEVSIESMMRQADPR
eukprot:scaffold77367_cov31-Tisochrysis_lutea.AAC.3